MQGTVRLGLAFAVLAIGSPVLAQTATLDAATIVDIFRPLPAGDLTADIAGRWVALPVDDLANDTDLDAFRARACDAVSGPVRTLAGAEAGGFTITQGTGDRMVTFHLDPLGDSLFSRMFDADALAAYLRLDQAPPETRVSVMRSISREVTVYRPTPDLLVLAAAGRAELLMRCME